MKLLLFLALLPGFVIVYQVYKMDKIEKEPIALLLFLLLAGAVVTIPIIYAELAFEDYVLINMPYDTLYLVVENFLGVALIEELGKFIMLKQITWKNRNFNFMFDGIVYSICVSMGFALVENVLYVLDGGIQLALIRGVLSVPGHAVFSIFMGLFYTFAKAAKMEGNNRACDGYLLLAVIVPMIFHGLFDFLLSSEYTIAFIIFLIFVVVLYSYSWKLLKKMSNEDMPNRY